MTRNALEVAGLTKKFGRLTALSDVSFTLPEGAVGGLVGPNGSGKTTFFSLVAGYLRPTAGTVELFGEMVTPTRSLRGLLGILPQDARFLRSVPIRRHLQFYGELMELGRDGAAEEARRVLEMVDLVESARREGDRLSHGMHKRMAIAQALIGSPKVILLDEPTAGLDPANARAIRDVIRERRGNSTVLVSSHNLDEIADVCDHVTILDKGRVVDSRQMSEFTRQSQVLSLSLNAAAPDEIIAAIQEQDFALSVKLSPDRRRLEITMAAADVDDADVVAAIVSTLGRFGLSFTDLRKGTSLEDRFLEVTRGEE